MISDATSNSTARDQAPRWLNLVARLLVIAAIGFAFGYAMDRIPSYHWFGLNGVANLAAPYAVLPFLVGAWGFRRPVGAVAGGILVEYAMFQGWYFEIAWKTHQPLRYFFEPVPAWLPFEVFAAVVFGWLGWYWWTRNKAWAGVVCALVVILEPLFLITWFDALVLGSLPGLNIGGSGSPRTAWNIFLWALELVAGMAFAVAAVRVARRRASIQVGSANSRSA
jgi:hypothetical protein